MVPPRARAVWFAFLGLARTDAMEHTRVGWRMGSPSPSPSLPTRLIGGQPPQMGEVEALEDAW